MFTRSLTPLDGMRAGALLFAGLVFGYALYRVVHRGLRRRATMTGFSGYDTLRLAARDAAVALLTLGGLYAAIVSLPFHPRAAAGLQRTVVALTIAVATLVCARAVAGLVMLYTLQTPGATRNSSIFVNIARVTVILVGFMILLSSLGVSITPMLTAMGVGGLAAALALQDTLSNLFAGIQVLASKKVRPGDYIKLDTGEEGWVVDINWRNTTLRQLIENLIVVPNSRISNAVITNYDRPRIDVGLIIPVRVAYGSDLEHVERITREVGAEVMGSVDGGVATFEPIIRYAALGDSGVDLNVILRARTYPDQYLIRHEFLKRLVVRYGEEGIEIPFPMLQVLSDGDAEADGAGEADRDADADSERDRVGQRMLGRRSG